jgi:hypothetical protein
MIQVSRGSAENPGACSAIRWFLPHCPQNRSRSGHSITPYRGEDAALEGGPGHSESVSFFTPEPHSHLPPSRHRQCLMSSVFSHSSEPAPESGKSSRNLLTSSEFTRTQQMPGVRALRPNRDVPRGPLGLRRRHGTGGRGCLVLPCCPRGPEHGPARVAVLPVGQRWSPPWLATCSRLVRSSAAPGWREGRGQA